jgi:hypothetical protein
VNACAEEGILFFDGGIDLLGVMSLFTVIQYIKGRSFVRDILKALSGQLKV